jgi:hypothetical protein
MSRIKKNELRKIIRKSLLKEFVPGQVSAGTVDSAAFSMQSRQQRAHSVMKPKGEGVYRALLSPQTLDFEVTSRPGAFETIIANADTFFQNYKLAFGNLIRNNIVIPPIFTNWLYSQGYPEQEIIKEASQAKLDRINELRKFKTLDVTGTYNGQLVIEGQSFQVLCQTAPFLLSKPFTSANVRDFIRIVELLGGETDAVDRAIKDIGAFPEWEEFKKDYLPGMINKANAVLGTKMQSGELASAGSSPLLYMDTSKNIYDALEYFKYKCYDLAPDAWLEYNVKWVAGGSSIVPWSSPGNLQVNIVRGTTQPIIGRVNDLLKQINDAAAAYETSLASLPASIITADELRKLRMQFRKTIEPEDSLEGFKTAAGMMGLTQNADGSKSSIATARNTKKLGRESKESTKNLLKEAPPVPITFTDWLNQLRASQQDPSLGNPADFDPMQTGDRVDLWLGPNPNVPPAVTQDVSGTGPLKAGDNPIAMWFLAQILQADNAAKIGLQKIKGEAGPPVISDKLILPNPKNLAFYFVQKSRTTKAEAYVNPFDIPGFYNEVRTELELRFKGWDIALGEGIEPTPEAADVEPEEEAEGKCPDTPFKPDFQKSQSDKLKQIEKVVDAYITLHSLTATVSSDGNPWNDMPAWKMLVNHAKENNPAFKAMSGVNWDKVAGDWAEGAPTLGGRGYTPNLNGMLAFAADAYNCNAEFGKKKISGGGGGTSKPEPEEAAEETEEAKPKGKKRTWRDIEVMFAGKAGRNKKVDTWKKEIAKTTAKFIVQNGLANVTREEHGIFDLGVGGRIKPRTSDDWRVSKQYKPVINKAINKIITGILKTRGTLEISIPPGHYSGMNEAAEFVDVLRTLIRDSK